jgi:RNase adapter protein RapZ
MELVIVSGMSGAGKTVALKQYEDLGYFCIDNLPLALIGGRSSRVVKSLEGSYEKIAIGIDARASAREIKAFPRYLGRLRERGLKVRVAFLTAADAVILRRYGETRRKHPLTSPELTLEQAIGRERQLLKPIADSADFVLDTGDFNLHQLREAISRREPTAARGKLGVTLLSFGFKNGVPEGIDFLFDVRCLPNPHWEQALRPLTGLDQKVVQFLEQHADVQNMLADLRGFLETWLPRIAGQDVAYLTVAVGCTGGRHRSPYIVERLAQHFRGRYDPLTVRHRELA